MLMPTFDCKLQAILNLPSEQATSSPEPSPGPSHPETAEVTFSPASGLVNATIHLLLRTLAARDPYTAHHSVRVTEIATCFALYLGLSSREIATLQTAVILHDIGKIGISDAILNKPGPLTPEERTIITTHPLIGDLIIEPLGLTACEREIILLHHERWDGTGYPQGLAGPKIPLLCRLTSLADVYDAMTSDRPYRDRFPAAQALAEIESQAGRLFDPDLTRKFVAFLSSARQKLPERLPAPRLAFFRRTAGRGKTQTSASPKT